MKALWDKYWHSRWWIKWPTAAFVALVVLAAVLPTAETDTDEEQPTDTPTEVAPASVEPEAEDTSEPEPTAEPTDESTPEPTEAAAEEPENGFGDGTHRVGDDIEPGIYRAEGGGSCYWERLAGFSGDFDDLITNGLGTGGPETVEILVGDAGFSSERCGTWIPLENLDLESRSIFADGSYVVGDEIAPGTWTTDGGSSCYWERLSGFSGGFDDLITNDLPTGRAIVTIDAADVGFRSQGCGEWTQ